MVAVTSRTSGNKLVGMARVKILLDSTEVAVIPSESIVEISFEEDIFSPFMKGKLVFNDTIGLHEFGYLSGNEVVSIRYGKEDEKEVLFHVLRMDKVIPSKSSESHSYVTISYDLVDRSFLPMTGYKFSRSFSPNSRVDNIMNHVLVNMAGWESSLVNIETTDNLSKFEDGFVIPFWNVLNTMKFLTKRAVSRDMGLPGYLFYTSTENGYGMNVRSLPWLLSENNVTDATPYFFESSDSNVSLSQKVLDWSIDGMDHQILKPLRNMHTLGYRFAEKSLFSNSEDKDFVDKIPVHGKYTMFDNGWEPNDIPSQYELTGESSSDMNKNVGRSNYIRRYNLGSQLFHIVVSGNERRYAGHQITIKWPSVDKEIQKFHKLWEGQFLVKRIKHSFQIVPGSNIAYTQQMDLIKNGLQSPDAENLKRASTKVLKPGKKEIINIDE